jgi:iron-sulfur cluster assembly protein
VLTLTDGAVAAIREITDQDNVPDGAGVRIAADPAAGALTLGLVPEPVSGDQVVDVSGARVFLDTQAAPILEDKALDAAVDSEGQIQFTVAEQHPG